MDVLLIAIGAFIVALLGYASVSASPTCSEAEAAAERARLMESIARSLF